MFQSFCFNTSKDIPSFRNFIEFKTKSDALDKIRSVRAASSGAFVGEGLVLTASHAVAKNERAKIFYKDRVCDAEPLVRLPELDILLLGITDRKLIGQIPTLGFSDSVLSLGQQLYGVGFPLPEKVYFNSLLYEMRVSRVEIDLNPDVFMCSGELSQGCSGMCLVDDRCKIVGVVVRKAKRGKRYPDLPNDWNLAVKRESFVNSIEKYIPYRSKSPSPRLTAEFIARRLNETAVVVLACSSSIQFNHKK